MDTARPLEALVRAANQILLVDGELDRIGEHFAESYQAHGTGRTLRGHAGLRAYIQRIRRAFPDLEVSMEILLEAGDRVAWQRTVTGTQRGAFAGFPATGQRVRWRDLVVSRVEEGRFVEDWVVTDLAEQLLRARSRPRPARGPRTATR